MTGVMHEPRLRLRDMPDRIVVQVVQLGGGVAFETVFVPEPEVWPDGKLEAEIIRLREENRELARDLARLRRLIGAVS